MKRYRLIKRAGKPHYSNFTILPVKSFFRISRNGITPENWAWLIAELDKIKQTQKNERAS